MKKIIKILDIISGAFFLACGGYVILNILSRTFFNHPLTGVYDITGLFAVVFAAGSVVVCVIQDGNVSVDVVVNRFKPKGQFIFKCISHVIDGLYYAILAWGAWKVGIVKLLGNELTTTAKFPIGPFRVFWAVCATLVVVVKVLKIINAKRGFKPAGKYAEKDDDALQE